MTAPAPLLPDGLLAAALRRDPATPLVTFYDDSTGERVELSATTLANWVAKTANLLTDDLGRPEPVGLLLPLHWQAVAALLGAVAAGGQVRLVDDPAGLAGCAAAFVPAERAAAALAAGVPDVLSLSADPMGRPSGVAAGALDFAEEVPAHGDHFTGPRPAAPQVRLGDGPAPVAGGLTAADRVLTTQPLTSPAGVATVLGALRAGAALVLVPGAGQPGDSADLAALAATERVTRVAGATVAGIAQVGAAHVGAPAGR